MATKFLAMPFKFIGGIASKVSGGDGYEVMDSKSTAKKEAEPESAGLKVYSSEEEDTLNSQPTDDQECFDLEAPYREGLLSKWTNYLHGWQERYFVVRNGILSYYKSEIDTQYGCRGSISLQKAKVMLHEFDELRFDIRAHDCTYFLRASSVEEKGNWIGTIEANKKYLADSGIETSIRRQGSILSLSALSQASTSSFKVGHDIHTKLAELETYRDILCRQVDTLQAYFDALAENPPSGATGDSGGSGGGPITMNGTCTSDESLDELPEEGIATGSNPDLGNNGSGGGVATAKSPTQLSSNANSNARTSSSTHSMNHLNHLHQSPLPSRFNPNSSRGGHRRTGSDPFTFRQPQLHGRGGSHTVATATAAAAAAAHTTGPPYHHHHNKGGGIGVNNIDFRGEAITFKATTAGILVSLSYCIESMNKREEYWQKRLEKEQERRQKAEFAAHSAMNGPRVKAFEYAGPDFEEGPHSALNDEEFYDALEMAFQRDERLALNEEEKEVTEAVSLPEVTTDEDSNKLEKLTHKPLSGETNRMTPMINDKVSKLSSSMFEPIDQSWNMVHTEGDLKVYRKELEQDGVVCDPHKISITVKGVSAYEVVDYFFDPSMRDQWDTFLDTFSTLETLTDDTRIFHQLLKRVWPSTQREILFCSHMCVLTNEPRPENCIGRTFMVCNFSIDHPDVQVTSKIIRATMLVGLVCQTILNKPCEPGQESELTRDDISCKLIYSAMANPGGWVPPIAARAVAKRELCTFVKKFAQLVHKHKQSLPLTLA